MGVGLGDSAASMRSYRQAVETEKAWLKITPDETSAMHSYAMDLLFLADTVKASGNLQEALTDYNRCLEMAKTVSQRTGSARRLRDVAVAYNRVGEIYEDEHNWRKALEQDEQALEIYRQLLARDPNDFIMRQGFAIALANVGIQKERMTPNRGLADIRQAVDMMEKIVAANKENAEQRGILASMYSALGDSFRAQHKPSETLREYQKALAINEKLYAGDPNNVDALQGIAGGKANIAEALAVMGKFEAASQSFSEALAAVNPALSAPKPDNGVLSIAAKSYAGLGDLELRLADHSTADAPVERRHWDKARTLFLMSRDAWQKIPPTLQRASISPDSSDAENVRRKLERCENQLKATEVARKQ
jgi:tetratricopeptide (TPR) repeat protein